ncbi:ABC transporter ATP-binding protein [Desulfospira joergensenii]|uniref:ABC transporter ATP-binding protein n=1 Tax=Desulfospira joergensenii TaxID=53329 RepID=UPI0003B3E59C|nr:ABC transporter ATP-binding protein [Desulfospira joergensenii]
MKNLLELRDIRVRFRTKGFLKALLDRGKEPFIEAVCSASMSIGQGETFALVGESGAGKTTLARSILGLVTPDQGSIAFKGKPLVRLNEKAFKPIKRDIAMMFQDPVGCLSPRLSVLSIVTEPFKIHGISLPDAKKEAIRLLDLVNLPASFLKSYPYQLSGGQARRVGVARALALNPKLIIADEPTAGLDVSVQGEILNLMYRLQQELGISFLVITHNLSVVRHTSDHMAIMYLGRFVETGPTDEIFKNPRHPYTQILLTSSPEPDPDAPKTRTILQGEIPSLINRPPGCEFNTRCPMAEDRCRSESPSLRRIGENHYISCFLEEQLKEQVHG